MPFTPWFPGRRLPQRPPAVKSLAGARSLRGLITLTVARAFLVAACTGSTAPAPQGSAPNPALFDPPPTRLPLYLQRRDGHRRRLPRLLYLELRDGPQLVASPAWESVAVWRFDASQSPAGAATGGGPGIAITDFVHDLEQGAFVAAGARNAAIYTSRNFDSADLVAVTAMHNGRPVPAVVAVPLAN